MTDEERLGLLGPDLVALADEVAAQAPPFTQHQQNALALLLGPQRRSDSDAA